MCIGGWGAGEKPTCSVGASGSTGVLDQAFREDEWRVRAGNAAHNFAEFRHVTLNFLEDIKTEVGVKTQRLRPGRDNDFLLQVLFG